MVKIRTAPQILELLWKEGFFESLKSLGEVKKRLEDIGCHYSDQNIYAALESADFLTKKGTGKKHRYAQKGSSGVLTLNDAVFPKKLEEALAKDFSTEINDLKLNFGRSGTCTAFLLRKILEKLIYIVMAKNKLDYVLVADPKTGKLLGLEAMIDKVSKQKVLGKHLLMPKTASNIGGIKFLGDTAAHNPLANVDVETITPVMPYIVTAYKELVSHL